MASRGITVDRDLLELMPSMVMMERCTGYDDYGQRQYDGRPMQFRCRIERRTRKVIGMDGQERVSSVQVYFAESPGFTPLDRITLPSTIPGPTQPNIITIEAQEDSHGPYYECAYT